MTRNYTHTLNVLGAALAVTFAVCAHAADADDSKFLQDAIQTDIAEVKMSELAVQHTNDNAVRQLAHRLQADHLTAMQETAALAKTLGVSVPSASTAEAEEHYAALTRLSGEEFDAVFVNHVVAGHRDAIGKFSEQTHANPNQAVSDLATKTLPTLKEHLAMAEALLADGAHPSADGHAAHAMQPDPQLRHGPEEPSTPPAR